ncbi:MAG: beta-lactamase family protein [Sphingomonas sp.]|nr:beta-lactamase family protein [Sphingomonas sp.]
MLPLAAAPLPALAQQAKPVDSVKIDKKRIDAALAAMVADGRAAGVEAVVWQDGRERYYGSAGFADREAKRPFARDTLVQIFSMTKPVTGTALMQLWEQGKFGLDDPVERYLPEFANARYVAGKDANGVPLYKPVSRPVTIRDLMRHSAGLSYGGGDSYADTLFAAAKPLDLDNDLAAAGKIIGGLPLAYDPGTQWRYSAAVDVQARLVEVLSGEKFSDYVRKHIFDPLGMKEAGWAQPADKFARLATGYAKGPDGKLARMGDEQIKGLSFAGHRMTMGGAGIVAPIDDYLRFARMLLGQGSLDGVRILRPSTVRLMSTDQLDPRVTERLWLPGKGSVGFGLDFAVRVSPPKDAKENRGAVGEFFWDGAWSTLFWIDPANKLTAVFFVQTAPFDGTLHHDFREAVYGKEYVGPAGD